MNSPKCEVGCLWYFLQVIHTLDIEAELIVSCILATFATTLTSTPVFFVTHSLTLAKLNV